MAVFALPDLGEGLTEASVLRWLVAPGDTVVLNQPVVEVETAKAAVEVPSPFAGVVAELHHAEGEEARVGDPLITITTAEAERTPVLVGYGPRTGTPGRRPRTTDLSNGSALPAPAAPAAPAPRPAGEEGARVLDADVRLPRTAAPDPRARPLAKPLVRKLAKERGVDLASVSATGPHGTVTREDVERAVAGASPGEPGGTPGSEPAAGAPAAVARGEAQPVTGVRRAMATAMTRSATVPSATLLLTVDVTASTQLVTKLRGQLEGVRVNALLLTARALLLALRRHPEANASWVDEGPAVVTHPQVNLGIAAATPRGLLVPNVKDAGSLSLVGLAGALDALVVTAREGRTAPADMAGGTATITNIGTFGIDTGTPVLNPGEAVILALGAVRPTPWVLDGAVVVRDVCQLALTFDHRVLDGQQAAQLLADVGAVLQDPDLVQAWV